MPTGFTVWEHGEVEPSVIVAMLDQCKEDALFLDAMMPELRKDYPDHFVAVYQKQVVGKGKNLKNLIRSLDENGVPKGLAVIEYVSSEPVGMIL